MGLEQLMRLTAVVSACPVSVDKLTRGSCMYHRLSASAAYVVQAV